MILSSIAGKSLWAKRAAVNVAHPRDPALARLFGLGSSTAAGVSVTPDNAQSATGVWACVDLIASSIASLPLHLYERMDDGGRRRVRDHPLYTILHDQPNPDQTAYEFREMMMGHLLLRGNAYAQIAYDGSGRVEQMVPLHPDRVLPFFHSGRVWYKYTPMSGGMEILQADDVFHVRGRPRDRLTGMSPIEEMANVVGISLAAEEYGAAFYRNGASPLGVLEYPGELDDDAHKQLRDEWEAMHRGARNSHKVAILEEGLTFKQIGLANRDAQFLETRRFQLEEQARMYRVPPPMIGILDRATFANSEQQESFFEKHTVRPHVVRFEQALRLRALSSTEQKRLYPEFDTSGLLRADTQARGQYYRELFMIGALSQNDIRRRENEERIEGGDRYFVPLNMVPTDQLDQIVTPSSDVLPDDDQDDDDDDEGRCCPGHSHSLKSEERSAKEQRSVTLRQRLRTSYRRLFSAAAARILLKEIKAIRAAAKKREDAAEFLRWLDEFYGETMTVIARNAYTPVVESYSEQAWTAVSDEVGTPPELPAGEIPAAVQTAAGEVVETLAARHLSSSHRQIAKIVEDAAAGEEWQPLVDARLDDWSERRADSIAARESVQIGEYLAIAAMALVGVTVIRWMTIGDNCPICDRMSGRTVQINKTFLSAGDSLEAGETSFTTRRSVGHPPLHKGCDCMVVPEVRL